MSHLSHIRQLDEVSPRKAIAYLFGIIDDWFCDGKFGEVDELLKSVNPTMCFYSEEVILGLLTISRPAKEKLLNYKLLYDRAITAWSGRGDEYVKSLLYGLEPGDKI